MDTHDRILVPTDGSDEVERAVDHAAGVAMLHGATLHALYVLDTEAYAGLPMETSWDSVAHLLREDAEAAVERVRDLVDDVPVETAVVEGTPSEEIVRYAEGQDCDLIVMGTHGRGGIDRLLLGSVTESVVRSSSVPVTAVPVGDGG